MRFDNSFARLATALCILFAAQSAVAQTAIINEVDADQTSTDSAEFIELYDGGAGNTDLTGLVLVLVNGSDDQSYNAFDLDGQSTNGSGYFVLCGNAANTANCDLDVSPDTNLIQNGADGVALLVGDAVNYPNDTVVGTSGLIDAIVYDTNDSDDAGLAYLLNVGQPQVNEGGSGDKDGHSNQRCPNGTGGARNTDTYAQFAPTPGAENSCGALTIFINEVDADQTSTDSAEFIELYDGGAGNTDLTGLVLVLVNGSDDQSYNAFDLDGQSTNGSGYFVLCGNAATTANCDLDVSPDTNLIQNGADGVALLVGDAVNYPNDTVVGTPDLIDAIVYDTNDSDDAGLAYLLNVGQPQVNEGGSGNQTGHSNQRCPNGTGGARNTDTYAQFDPTPGEENLCEVPVVATPYFIHQIQGSGTATPIPGELVVINGVVVGDFQDGASGTNGDLNGFFVQEEDADADGDSATSEGIFVFDGSSPATDVAIGEAVTVEGTVSEFGGMTQITSFSGVSVNGAGSMPSVTALSLPFSIVGQFEAYEGMYVTFVQPLVIAEYFNFDRFGEIVLTTERYLTPTAEFEPGPDANAAADAFLLNRITLDDGRTAQNPDPAIHPNGAVFDLTNLFRGGDTVTDVTGVMAHAFGLYRVQPTQGADHSNNNPRTAAPDDVEGSLTLASANVLNYFTTLDYPSGHPLDNMCGPSENMGCRGADNADELARQRAKIIASLATMDADIVGLVEIENNVADDAVIDLVAGLNDAMGPGTYDYVATGTIGTDAIKVAFIYQPEAVSLVGGYAILDSVVDSRFLDTKNRPVLAQTFIDNSTGGVFTVAVNHFKSKGSSCNDVGDPDMGDGAGNCNLTRTAAAEALVDWLADDPTNSGDDDFIIIGDLNSYDKEDPIDAILAGGYTDLIADFRGEDAYSYVFDGQTGYLDHALANENLSDQVTGTTEWHINADEPDLINYDTSFKRPAQDALYAPDPYRSSDHDPVVVGLETCDEIAPTIDGIALTPNVLWPANHKYVDVDATVFASDNFDPDLTVTLVSVTSNEPDNGVGDGNTVDDIVIVDDLTLKLRAERAGGGSGRIYTITYQATDDCGNSVTAEAAVTVPHNKGKK